MVAAVLPEHESMVASILATYDRATDDELVMGARWYPRAGAIVRGIATDTDSADDTVALVLAALSPRNPWAWNVADAYAFMVAARSGGARPTATTFDVNAARAWAVATGITADPWAGAAPKVRAFVDAILGDPSAVVIDTWAARVATDGAMAQPGRHYGAMAAAYRAAATREGVAARDMQAITWLVAQREGLASQRRGRHDLAIKRGTHPRAVELLQED